MHTQALSAEERSPQASALSPSPLHVYVAGVGSVGRTLLHQLSELPQYPTELRVIGVCTSFHSSWLEADADARSMLKALETGEPLDWPTTLEYLKHEAPRPLAFVDATGSHEVAGYYDDLLGAGIHLATPSKLANTQQQVYFDRLQKLAADNGASYRYETTVGAGLPVVQTLKNLIGTGDTIREIRGCVSGTLTFLFSQMRRGFSFSEAIAEAAAQGYTEPDVRDDLSGEDVARKFLILARTAGLQVERSELSVDSLVPDELRRVTPNDFLQQASQLNAAWQQRTRQAQEKKTALQYVGHLTRDHISVGVTEVATQSPLGTLKGTDNLIEIYTDRYADSPLIVRGPGAGPEVTAAGVLSDVLHIARTAAGTP